MNTVRHLSPSMEDLGRQGDHVEQRDHLYLDSEFCSMRQSYSTSTQLARPYTLNLTDASRALEENRGKRRFGKGGPLNLDWAERM